MLHISPDTPLTNQYLSDRFSSPFALLSAAIAKCRDFAYGDKPVLPQGAVLNQAYQILRELEKETRPVSKS